MFPSVERDMHRGLFFDPTKIRPYTTKFINQVREDLLSYQLERMPPKRIKNAYVEEEAEEDPIEEVFDVVEGKRKGGKEEKGTGKKVLFQPWHMNERSPSRHVTIFLPPVSPILRHPLPPSR